MELTKDTIELSESERKSRLLGRLSEILLLDGEVSDREGVLREEALEGSGTVVDLEGGSVGLVGRRGGRVVLGVKLKSAKRKEEGKSSEGEGGRRGEGVVPKRTETEGGERRRTHEASDGGALGSRDPKVGGSGVEDDLEELRGCSEGDLGEVLSVEVV